MAEFEEDYAHSTARKRDAKEHPCQEGDSEVIV